MIVNNVIYVDGKRVATPSSLDETYELCHALHGMTWIGMYEPTAAEFQSVADEFDLHELAVEDAVKAHQRPKLELYGTTLFVVLRAAVYVDPTDFIEFSEIHLFVGEDFVITVRHGEHPDLNEVRTRMEADPELLSLGPAAVLYGIMDEVVDLYQQVIAGVVHDIDEIEIEVFGGTPDISKRVYALAREVIEFQHAVSPLTPMLIKLRTGASGYHFDPTLQDYFRDVQDHVIQVQGQIDAFRDLLQNVLTVNLAIVGLQQNEEVKRLSEIAISQNDEVKKISAWAAILFAPTLVGTIYGMNFVNMPELDWRFGYPLALLMMFSVSLILWRIFKRRGWLS